MTIILYSTFNLTYICENAQTQALHEPIAFICTGRVRFVVGWLVISCHVGFAAVVIAAIAALIDDQERSTATVKMKFNLI